MGKRLVSEESINFMHTPKIDAGFGPWGEKRHYCEGWVRSEYDTYSILWHNGGTSGMKSIAAMVPEAGIGIVVLSNLYETLLPEALSRVLFDLLFGCPFRDWSRELLKIKAADANRLQDSPAPHTRPRPLALYTGTYYNCLYGPVTVAKTGCSLTITLGPKKIRSKLQQ
ncbi:serine hydrolase, partial [bacterium]